MGTLRIDPTIVSTAIKAYRSKSQSESSKVVSLASDTARAMVTNMYKKMLKLGPGSRCVGRVVAYENPLFATLLLPNGTVATCDITHLADNDNWVDCAVEKLPLYKVCIAPRCVKMLIELTSWLPGAACGLRYSG